MPLQPFPTPSPLAGWLFLAVATSPLWLWTVAFIVFAGIMRKKKPALALGFVVYVAGFIAIYLFLGHLMELKD